MRSRFDEQLELLNTQLIEMGALIEAAIQSAAQALIGQDVAQARKAKEFDAEIDEKERSIEAICMKLLLHQQPVAKDLRLISAALKMITDMERIGDQAGDISELVTFMAGEPYIKKLEHLPQMAEVTQHMVSKAIDAFVRRDLALAQEVMAMDDIVDGLFDDIKQELIGLITQNAANGSQCIDFLMIAKYYERIGDHAVNIAEWVEYAITGIHRSEEQ